MKNNKMKKFAISSLSIAMLSTMPVKSYAWFGVGDFNIIDNFMQLNKLFETAWKQMESFFKNKADSLFQGAQFEQKVNLEKVKTQLENLKSKMPSPQACENMLTNRTYLAAASGSAKNGSKKTSETTKKQQTSGTEANQINEDRKKAIGSTCTAEDIKTGINGCGTTEEGGAKVYLSAGQDRNPAIVDGTTFVVKINGQDVVVNAGETIVDDGGFKVLDGIDLNANGQKFKGKEALDLYINNMIGVKPIPIASKEINKEKDGQAYTSKINKYNARIDTVQNALVRITQGRNSANGILNDPAVKAFWDDKNNEKLLQELNGGNKPSSGFYGVVPKTPSEDQLLKLIVYNHFTKEKVASNEVGGKKEMQLLVLNNLLLYKLWEEQRTTNKLLITMVAQQIDPINVQEINRLRNMINTQIKH